MDFWEENGALLSDLHDDFGQYREAVATTHRSGFICILKCLSRFLHSEMKTDS